MAFRFVFFCIAGRYFKLVILSSLIWRRSDTINQKWFGYPTSFQACRSCLTNSNHYSNAILYFRRPIAIPLNTYYYYCLGASYHHWPRTKRENRDGTIALPMIAIKCRSYLAQDARNSISHHNRYPCAVA